jgi:hypothetical protein
MNGIFALPFLMVGNGSRCFVAVPLLNSGSAVSRQPQDQAAICQLLALPVIVLDAVALIDQQLLVGGAEQELAIEKRSSLNRSRELRSPSQLRQRSLWCVIGFLAK